MLIGLLLLLGLGGLGALWMAGLVDLETGFTPLVETVKNTLIRLHG